MDEKRLESNLVSFAKLYPKEAIKMAELTPESPSAAGGRFFDEIPKEACEVVAVFGVDSGEVYQEAADWLKQDPKRRFVYFEDSLKRLRAFLESEAAAALFMDPQAEVHAVQDLSQGTFQEIGWSWLGQSILPLALPDYEARRPEDAATFKRLVTYEAERKKEVVDEYLKLGIVFYRNFYQNLWTLPDAFWGHDLFGAFKNVPAIICGAGPSLEKHLPKLKKLKDRALIIAGGSALKALQSGGARPHFGVGIDPNPSQLDRIRGWECAAPFFYRGRMHAEALRHVKGPKLYLAGSGGYDTAEWFERRFGLECDALDEGHNVVNFSAEIARMLGCSPIIFVGIDLAFTNDAAYAPGVEDASSLPEEAQLILETDIYGNPVKTLWKWTAEAKWLADYAEEHKEVAWVNATEGGIGIRGVPHQALEDLNFDRCGSVDARAFQALHSLKRTGVRTEDVAAAMKTLAGSLERASAALQTLIDEGEALHAKIEEGDRLDLQQTGRAALAEIDLAEEEAYPAVLEMFNAIYVKMHHHRLFEMQKGSDEREKKLGQLELGISKYKFLKAVADANLLLMKPMITP